MNAPGTDTLKLEDRARIADLLLRYCDACDRNDPDGVAACFTEDCLAFYGPGDGVRGREARQETAARDLALFEATSHHLSNVVVRFESDDRAIVSSHIYAWHRPLAGGDDWELWGRYEDVVVRADGEWWIQERRLAIAGVAGFPSDWEWLHVHRHGVN